MPTVTTTRTIEAPIARVWSVFTDLESSQEHLSAVEDVEVLTDGPFAVGTTWRETRKMFGRTATEEMQVTAVEHQASYAVGAVSQGTTYTSRFDFREIDPRTTEVRFTFTGETQGSVRKTISAVMWPLFRGKVAKELRRDLDDLAEVCEKRPR
jgi:carbon monoxide dehydrogenase subunit G